jgi:streptomycin 6-kinase
MSPPPATDLGRRVEERVRAWRVAVEHRAETESSVLVFGRRDDRPVVLKIVKVGGDEWTSGAVLEAFDGNGVVRVLDQIDGALLLERLSPGTPLTSLVVRGDDHRATGILADVIARMSPRQPPDGTPTAEDWGEGFTRHAASGDASIPRTLLLEAGRLYAWLCRSQSRVRLLHGDLHHGNVLHDSGRGWVAIDPKGVVGELEYETGAALRNPQGHPGLFTDPTVITRRVDQLAQALELDAGRILGWAFAQAVLSAIWTVEDGLAFEPHGAACVALAGVLRTMLDTRARRS